MSPDHTIVELERTVRKLSILHELTWCLGRSKDPGDGLVEFLRRLVRALDCDVAMLFDVSGDDETFGARPIANFGVGRRFLDRVHLDASLATVWTERVNTFDSAVDGLDGLFPAHPTRRWSGYAVRTAENGRTNGLLVVGFVERTAADWSELLSELSRWVAATLKQRWLLAELNRSLLEERAARGAALAADQAKSRFLAMVSHELRTPLNGIVGAAQLLSDLSLPDEACDLVDIVSTTSETLVLLIDDLLHYTKLGTYEVQVEARPFDPRDVVAEVLSLLDATADARGIEFGAHVDDGVPPLIESDPTRFKQLLMNLTSNALKFTDEGHVRIHLDRVDDALRARVEDTGIGISEAEAARIFDPFAQADASTTRRYGGTGLGLAICLRIAQVFGGTIGLQSEVGVGSTFEVRFPCVVPRGAPRVASRGSTRAEHPLNVLVVDDDKINRKIAGRMLERRGCQVHFAVNGAEALDALVADPNVDLVLMDVRMPVMDGIEATRQILSVPTLAHLPIVALTANTFPEERAGCAAAGMVDFIAKPMQLERLNEVLERFACAVSVESRESSTKAVTPRG